MTARGKRTLETLTEARTKDTDEFFGRLTEQERTALRDILGKLTL
ncbi:hypothetical protein [Nocardia sp. NPDC057272]